MCRIKCRYRSNLLHFGVGKGMSGQLQAPAALRPPQDLPKPIENEAGWNLQPVWTLREKEKSLASNENGTRIPRSPRSWPIYTDYSTLLTS